MPDILMKCGCRAQAYKEEDGTKIYYCIIHDCKEVMEDQPDLTGRRARCSYYGTRAKYGKCSGEEDSSLHLAFFEYRPNAKYDTYYCGCWGWD